MIPSCVQYYREIRACSNPDAEQIGSGRNLFPPAVGVLDVLSRASNELLRSTRVTRYDSSHDRDMRNVAAALVNLYLDADYEADDIFFIHGSTEGIDLVAEWGASAGYGYLLPLPCYFAYEDATFRRGGSRFGYYSDGSQVYGDALSTGPYCLFVNDPCGISGKPAGLPSNLRDPALTVFDFVHQMQDLRGASSRASARALTREAPPESSVVMFTASKDLSLPGLRAAVMATNSPGLRAFVRATQFTRYYTPNPMIGLAMITYLALLNSVHDANCAPAVLDAVRSCGPVSSILDDDLSAQFASHRERMVDNLRRAADVMSEYTQLFADVPADLPFAGYSAMMRLREDIVGPDEDLTGIATRALGGHALKLNPARMFGGDRRAWVRLHASAARVRVNLSVGEDELRGQLGALSGALGVRDLRLSLPRA